MGIDRYLPRYCPNSECLFHDEQKCKSSGVQFYLKSGFGNSRRRDGEAAQRYRCRHCRRRFCADSLHLNFRYKKRDPGLSAKIFRLFTHGTSNRRIAEDLKISEFCVRIRLKRLVLWGMSLHRERIEKMLITETLCYDGLENFAVSQYEPNHINHAIGRDTLFTYDFNFAPLNRKGRTSDRQKVILGKIETAYGRFPTNAIRLATTQLLQRLHQMHPPGHTMILCTDEHLAYQKSVQVDLKHLKIDHLTVSSKKTRNYQNILFAVNHSDLLIRQNVGAFARETIKFSKTHAAMCQKYALWMIYKNYMRTQFTKEQVRRPQANLRSPAMAVGIEKKVLEFHEFFCTRPPNRQLPPDWHLFSQNQVPYCRVKA